MEAEVQAKILLIPWNSQEFLGGAVAKTPYNECKGPGFNPCSGNQILQTTTKRSLMP